MFLTDFLRAVFTGHVSPVLPVHPVPPLSPLSPPPRAEAGWQQVLLTLHNEARSTRRAGPLEFHPRLASAAQGYANWMAANASLPQYHTGGNGGTLEGRLDVVGYTPWTAGENTARGQRTPDTVFDGWMHSPRHYKNVVNRTFTQVGFGMALGADGLPYWCAVFASPLPARQSFSAGPDWCPPGLDATAPWQE